MIDPLVEFATRVNADLHLIHVNELEAPDPGYYLEELFKEKYPDQNITLSSVYNSDVIEGIDAYAQENNIDMIVMGTKSRSFFNRIFHKSMTKKMALQCELPLLILKPNNK